jgi:predicted PurR-regulated permease PerM
MVRRWFHEKTENWRASALMNGLGAFATLVVLIVIICTKFLLGAWLVVVAIPLVVTLFAAIHQHYQYVSQRLSIHDLAPRSYISVPKPAVITHPAVVVVGQLNRGTVEALDYARTIADEIVAIHVDIGSTDRKELQRKWQNLESDIPLEIIESPYRSVIDPIVDFVGQFQKSHPDVFTTIIIPVFVPRNWWDSILHNQTTLFLKNALRANKSRIVTTVRYYL